MAAAESTFGIRPGAEDDARDRDNDCKSLWHDAIERLRADPTPTYSLPDPAVTSGPPIHFHIRFNETCAIYVGYKYVPETKALVVISVEAYPVQDEKVERVARRAPTSWKSA